MLRNKHGERIVICDFDEGEYGNRGIDFVELFRSWKHQNNTFDRYNMAYPPEDILLEQLLQYYHEENVRLFGVEYSKTSLNSVKHYIKEMKVFWLWRQFFAVTRLVMMLDDSDQVDGHLLNLFRQELPDKNTLMVK